MQKKDTIATGKLTTKNLREGFKCGECLHFKAHALRSKQQVCSKEGIRSFAVAPNCFTPDITKIAGSSDQLLMLASLFQNYTAQQRRILIGVLRSKKKKLAFGTKIYFKAVGRDYLSNYLSGFVMGYTSGGELMVSGDPDKTRRGNSYVATFQSESDVYTHSEFKTKKQDLIKKGRTVDPDKPLRKFKQNQPLLDWEPPTMDTAPASWHDKSKEPKKSKKSNSKVPSNEIRIR